jgi:hypothetical protein
VLGSNGSENRFKKSSDTDVPGVYSSFFSVRFLGVFLENPSETPPGVVAYLGHQLGIKETGNFSDYCVGEVRWDHAAEIERFILLQYVCN